MYIPTTVLPLATLLGDTPSSCAIRGSAAIGHAILVARKAVALRGRAGLAMGSGVAIAFIGAIVLGILARCMIRERTAKKRAKSHVQALAMQDMEIWDSNGIPGRRTRQPMKRASTLDEGTHSNKERKKSEGIDAREPSAVPVTKPEPIYRGLRFCSGVPSLRTSI